MKINVNRRSRKTRSAMKASARKGATRKSGGLKIRSVVKAGGLSSINHSRISL